MARSSRAPQPTDPADFEVAMPAMHTLVPDLAPGRSPDAAAAGDAPFRVRHPAADSTRRQRRDIFDLQTELIREEGPYVRPAPQPDDPRQLALAASVRASGNGIEQPIGVRWVPDGAGKRWILVYGRRRLHAARAAGLAHVPVRDYGHIDELQALLLQGKENKARTGQRAYDDALMVHTLRERGAQGKDVAELLGVDPGWVSVMRTAGETIQALTAPERDALAAPGRLTFRDCQTLKARDPLATRLATLRALLTAPASASKSDQEEDGEGDDGQAQPTTAGSPSPVVGSARGRTVRDDEREARGPFAAHESRKGRRLQVTYRERDLRENPRAFVDGLARFLEAELEYLVARLTQIAEEGRSDGESAELAAAKERALQLAEWVRTTADAAPTR